MSMHQYLKRFRPSPKRSQRARRPEIFRRRSRLEALEDRTLLSILFNDQSTATTSDGGGPVISHPHVELIFWGSGWNTGSGPTLRANVQAGVVSITTGPYLSPMNQYRSTIGAGSLRESVTITSSSPPSVFSNNDVFNMLNANIGRTLPSADSDPSLLYMVIPQPGSTAGSLGGLHTYITYGAGHSNAHYGWTINDNSLDDITYFYSHELAEAVSDPEGTAIQVNPRNSTSWNEICDGEAQSYSYRLNGYVVNSWFASANHAYIVPTGQAQNFFVSSGRVLSVNGDQLANQNDTISIDLNGGVRATLNGEVAQFDPGRINGINVSSGNGTDTINVLTTTSSAPLNISSGGTATVNIGLNGSVQGIGGSVTITNPPSFTTVNVDDSSDSTTRTVTLNSITIGADIYGQVSGLAPAPIRYRYNDTRDVNVRTGTGVVTVNVLSTGGIGTTTLWGNSGSTTVNVGNGSVAGILAPLTIENEPSFTTINVDGSSDSTTRTVTLDSPTAGFGRISGLGSAPIGYDYIDVRDVNVRTGTGGATVNVLSTGGIGTTSFLGNASASNTLVGPNAATTWSITGTDSGGLNSSLTSNVTFSSFQNLTGGTGSNAFVFSDSAGVSGNIVGGGGSNTLDYSAYSSSVLVNLQTALATGVGGLVSNIQNVIGGSGGGDGGAYNILVGNGGNTLTGGNGRRNLLIAGPGGGTLIGGDDEDILVGGSTAYDLETDFASLMAIMGEWTRTDEDYGTRVSNVTSGNGVPLLDATTVTGNGAGNSLTGGSGLDLFYGDLALDSYDWDSSSETFVPV